MSQPKVYEFAKEMGIETIALMDKIREWKLPVKSHMAALDEGMIEEIKTRLEEDSASKGKKKTKKKAAKKKAATKKKATKKKAVKKTAKKTAKKTTTVRKASGTSTITEDATKKKATKKKKTTARKVIRRRAGEKEEEAAKAAAAAEAAAAMPAPPAEGVVADQGEAISGEESTQVAAAQVTVEDTDKEGEPKRGRNIVGRMDLTRVQGRGPQSGGAGSTSGAAGRPSRSAPRNLRAGFVASDPTIDNFRPAVEERKKDDKAVPKKKPGAGGVKEAEAPKFEAADFRKREVIFQPKKKRLMVNRESKKTQITTPKASKRVVRVYGSIQVQDLAQEMGLKAAALIKVLMKNGVMANMNMELDFDTVSLIVPEFGWEAENVQRSETELLDDTAFGELDAEKVPRPPVVTVMGHVDHGKTTLLDSIRSANVAKGEAGGITQHIGAYTVQLESGHMITFIDTPGHAAFTEMRARGANVTDIAIIVVAADDGMMPQTEEAINHAKAAGVPIVVAVNKMDRPNANPDRIKQQLSEFELLPEDWGGSTIFCPVSAINGEGIAELLEQVHLVAEMEDLKANPKRSATGVVIEAKMEKGKGAVASLLIKDGTMTIGQPVVAGQVAGRIRTMMNDRGETVKEAGPGFAVEIMGLPETPQAGDRFDVCKNEEKAREVAQLRKDQAEKEAIPSSKMSLDELFSKVKSGDVKELGIVLKADVAGSIEAIKGVIDKLETEEVKVKIIHSAVGAISESDVLLAGTAGGIVIGFNVRPDTAAARVAKEKGVEIKTYNVIYEMGDDLKKAMSGLLSPDVVEKSMGRAEVRDTFSVPKMGVIAGCFVEDGKVSRNHLLRLVRDGRVVYEGKVGSLRRFKDDVKEVNSGYECGIGIENFNDIKVGDVIESYIKEEVAREL